MINKVRGTQDLYGKKINKLQHIVTNFTRIANLYGYSQIRTPILENIETFVRSVGETSDIVKKEFYNFIDKGGREVALRPEGTAPVIRCVIEEKLLYSLPKPLKFYYTGPMFRYERPQSGRYREFDQFGYEIIDSNTIYDDFEIIKLNVDSLKSVGIMDVTIKINNLGTFDSREKWINSLKQYFKKYKNELSELSQERLEKNPTRILDDKIDGIKEFVKKAPKISDFLSKEEKTQHSGLLKLLSEFKIKYEIDETLVRGLDYYTNMVFEIINKDGLALGGGGRYSKLVSEFGGEDVNCVGSAFGISRIIDELSMAIESSIDIVFAPMVNKAEVRVLNYLNKCREKGISCVAKYGFNKLTNVFKYAQNVNAKYVIIVGEKELKDNTISIKNQKTMDQKNIDFIDFINSF